MEVRNALKWQQAHIKFGSLTNGEQYSVFMIYLWHDWHMYKSSASLNEQPRKHNTNSIVV